MTDLDKKILALLIHQTTLSHPLPWHIELDWTVEVVDVNDKIVCKFMTTDEAKHFIKLAEDSVEESKEIDREVEEIINGS